MLNHIQEYRIGNHTVKVIPNIIIPINSDQERVIDYTIEVYHKSILRTKLIKRQKYDPLPILTIRAFLDTLSDK